MKDLLGDIGDDNLLKEAEVMSGMSMSSEYNMSRMLKLVNKMRTDAAANGMTAKAVYLEVVKHSPTRPLLLQQVILITLGFTLAWP